MPLNCHLCSSVIIVSVNAENVIFFWNFVYSNDLVDELEYQKFLFYFSEEFIVSNIFLNL